MAPEMGVGLAPWAAVAVFSRASAGETVGSINPSPLRPPARSAS